MLNYGKIRQRAVNCSFINNYNAHLKSRKDGFEYFTYDTLLALNNWLEWKTRIVNNKNNDSKETTPPISSFMYKDNLTPFKNRFLK